MRRKVGPHFGCVRQKAHVVPVNIFGGNRFPKSILYPRAAPPRLPALDLRGYGLQLF